MPIKFEIYRDGERLTALRAGCADGRGAGERSIPAEIHFRDGLLTVNRKDDHATGLALLWDCGPLGAFHLETTRLMPREKPYNLNVELARARLMKIMQKQEDWNLFDFPKAERFSNQFHDAQMLFAESLWVICTTGGGARAGRSVAGHGAGSVRELSNFHCDLLLNRRRDRRIRSLSTSLAAGSIRQCRTNGIKRSRRRSLITSCCRCRGSGCSRRSTVRNAAAG